MGTLSTVNRPLSFLVTCEHGGHDVPADFRDVFATPLAKTWLKSHRGYDPGSLIAAQRIAQHLDSVLISSTTTRLLVDLNRSLDNPTLLSRFTATLPEDRKRQILDRHYTPYRDEVRSTIDTLVNQGRTVIHLSVHTFTPRIAGVWRPIDIGLLYDPSRDLETKFCRRWRKDALARFPRRRVLMNQPYAGTADGLTTALRTVYGAAQYLGIEIEINHRFFKRSPAAQERLVEELIASGLSGSDGIDNT